MGPETLRALNEGVNRGQLDEMGITEGSDAVPNRSSFAFDHVTADFGPGASAAQEELRNLVAEVKYTECMFTCMLSSSWFCHLLSVPGPLLSFLVLGALRLPAGGAV